MHVSLIQVTREDLHVATTTINLLLMLDCKLNDQRLALIAERLKAGRGSIEACILARLQT